MHSPHDERFEFVKLEVPSTWLSFTKGTGGTFKSNGKMKLAPGHSLAKKFPEKVATKEEMKERKAKMKAATTGGAKAKGSDAVPSSINGVDINQKFSVPKGVTNTPPVPKGMSLKEHYQKLRNDFQAEAKSLGEQTSKVNAWLRGEANKMREAAGLDEFKWAGSKESREWRKRPDIKKAMSFVDKAESRRSYANKQADRYFNRG